MRYAHRFWSALLALFIMLFLTSAVWAFQITNNMPAIAAIGQADLYAEWMPGHGPAGTENPAVLAIDPDRQLLFVGDGWEHNNRILVFDLSRGVYNGMEASWVLGRTGFYDEDWSVSSWETPPLQLTNWMIPEHGCTTVPNACSFTFPQQMEYDRVRQRLFVNDYFNGRIMIYDLSLGIVNGMPATWVLGQPDFQSGWGDAKCPIIDDPNSEWYGWNDWSTVFDRGNPAYPECNVPDGTVNPCSFNVALSMTYDEPGNRLFVGDLNNDRILVFELAQGIQNGMPATHVIGRSDLYTGGDIPNQCCVSNATQFLGSLGGMAYDKNHQRLFVNEWMTQRIKVFDLSGGIVDGMAATGVLGAFDYTTPIYEPGPPFAPNSIFEAFDLKYDTNHDRLFVPEYDARTNFIQIFEFPNGVVTNGMDASYILGQPDFTTDDINMACDGLSVGAANPCGMGNVRTMAYDVVNDRIFAGDQWNGRVMVWGLAVEGAPVVITGSGDPNSTTTTVNPDGSTSVAFEDGAGQAFEVTFPAGTTLAEGSEAVSVTTATQGGRVSVQVSGIELPPGTTKSIGVPLSAANKKICIKDQSNAQFGGTCPNAYAYAIPAAGACATYNVAGDPGEPIHPVLVCNLAGQLELSGLLHTVIELLVDEDNDGVEDEADWCPGTVLGGPIPSVSLKPNHMGDNQLINGCNATQVLGCKPGQNLGERKFGITPGTQEVFSTRTGWAANCF